MSATIDFPFLTAYDPPGTSEGSLDPLGLYQIADQLAMQLVPGVRERMQRVRFLTAMAVGAFVRDGVDDSGEDPDSSAFLVWEWLIVEAMVRILDDDDSVWGVPGTLVTRRALDRYGYLDARSYLKVPRIFGFHGVYKRLAMHLGIIDVHLGPGPEAEALADAWARGMGFANLNGARTLLEKWSAAVDRSLSESPPRTRPGWSSADWEELALAFAPLEIGTRERGELQSMLLRVDDRQASALQALWALQHEFPEDDLDERAIHRRLGETAPAFESLLHAIGSYESFARSLQDAFDLLRAHAGRRDGQGFAVTRIGEDGDFRRSVDRLDEKFEAAHRALGEIRCETFSLPNLFADRFAAFAEPLDAAACSVGLCEHHETIQRQNSAEGKRPWFDRLGQDRIYIRHNYRLERQQIRPDRYLHYYRGWPIRRFHDDLS
jgi:hypothetical protein